MAHRLWSEDAGVLVLGTLTKLLLMLAVLATVGFDTISITATQLTVRDHAQVAAQIGHDVLQDKGTPQAAYAAVLEYAKGSGDTVVPKSFTVSSKNTVTVTLRRDAATIAARFVPKANTYVTAIATGTATNPVP